jgi:hypothetical protein
MPNENEPSQAPPQPQPPQPPQQSSLSTAEARNLATTTKSVRFQ